MPSSLPVWFSIYFPIYTFDVLSCLPVIYHQPLSLLACMSVSSCIHFPFTVIIFYRKPPSSTRMTTENETMGEDTRTERRTQQKKTGAVRPSDNIGKRIKCYIPKATIYAASWWQHTEITLRCQLLFYCLFFLKNMNKHSEAWVSVLLRYTLYTRTRDRLRDARNGRNTWIHTENLRLNSCVYS